MKSLDKVNLNSASATLAVANTPLFLLRKLRADPAVHTVSERCTGQVLFSELKKALNQEPSSLTDLVKPYVYIVALSLRGDIKRLRQAQNVSARYHMWFGYIASVLVVQHQPTTTLRVHLRPELDKPKISRKSEVPTSVVRATVPRN